jgi:hypothetical protein
LPDPVDIQPGEASKHWVWLCYGEPGIKKTRDIVGTLPGNNLVLKPPTDHIDAMKPADRQRVKVWTLKDWDDAARAEDYLRSEGTKWDHVIVDSASLLQDHLLDDELETEINEISRNPRRALFGPDEGVYGRNMFKLAAFFRHIIGPDAFNLVIICHASTVPMPSPDVDEEGDPIPKLMPWIQGKNMSTKICGYTHMVTLMAQNDKGRRYLRTQSNQYFYAKDQFHVAPDGVIWDPTGEKVVKLINERRGQSAASTTTRAKPRRVTKRRSS